MARRTPDPAPEPDYLPYAASAALRDAIVEWARNPAAFGSTPANVRGVSTTTYANTSHSDGSFHPTHIGTDAAGTDPAARGTRAA